MISVMMVYFIIPGLLIPLLLFIITAVILAILLSERLREKRQARFARTRAGVEESRRLMQLLADGKIDQATYERMVEELEEKYQKT